MEQQLITDSWLLVSAEGFRQQQAGRDPALLVKELLQNSLDASPTSIDFTIEHVPSEGTERTFEASIGSRYFAHAFGRRISGFNTNADRDSS
jgi:hypothetical protein